MNNDKHRPFLKWAGNKYSLLSTLKPLLPSASRLLEPFVGTAAVSLNTNYPEYLLFDNNPDLIHFYSTLQLHGTTFIDYCRSFFIKKNNLAEIYYQFREKFNTNTQELEKAALFLYLNRHGYNGLCRYNNKGRYNVPFGRHNDIYFPQKELEYFLEKLRNAQFQCGDFAELFLKAQPGDVIYCDPPYVPLSNTASFCRYSYLRFEFGDHQRLVLAAQQACARGITVIISNHDLPLTRTLYGNAKIISLPVARVISRDINNRRPVQELFAIYTPCA